jgi:hypothetical protein
LRIRRYRVIPATAVDGVYPAVYRVDRVIIVLTRDRVLARTTVDRVAVVASIDRIVARITVERVAVVVSINGVVAYPTPDCVITITAIDRVGAAQAFYVVVAGSAGDIIEPLGALAGVGGCSAGRARLVDR